jgi:ribose transport system ATP-binding protein
MTATGDREESPMPDGIGDGAAVAARPRVEIRGLSKTFPGTRALVDVDLEIEAGEIHALLGGNGSGKSTLIKILTGVYQADDDSGSLRVGAVEYPADGSTPELAREAGVHVVHQDLGVFADMTVAENFALGHGYELGRGPSINWRRQHRRAEALLERFEIEATPKTRLSQLSQATRTMIAIARALQDEEESGSRGLLVLDEPTAALPAHEVEQLLGTLRRYAGNGQSILYVSHRLEEVLELCDRATILRDGVKVGSYEMSELDEESLVRLIVGHQIDTVFPQMPAVTDRVEVLRVRDLYAGPLRGVNLSVVRGEVVGIGGLLGSGRSELLRAVFGDLPIRSGEIDINGEAVTVSSPDQAMAMGVAYVPENRAADATFMDLSVATNITMGSIRDYWRRGRIVYRKMREDARRYMDEFFIKAESDGAMLATLSGGNQQKVMLARWLRRKPTLLLLDEPTHGVDVGARAEIYGLIRRAVSEGAAALIVASDFEELAHVSDRVLILRDGAVSGELTQSNLDAEALMQAANKRVGG